MKTHVLALGLLLGCAGAATPRAETATPEELAFTPEELAKIDDALLDELRRAEDDRVPIQVRFEEPPSRAVLESLLLVKYGERYIGQVPRFTLKRIVERGDVLRVEMLTNVGYAPT